MADIADDADRFIEAAIASSIAAAARAKPAVQPQGYCLNCGATELPCGAAWPASYRWCDHECQEDWSRATRVR